MSTNNKKAQGGVKKSALVLNVETVKEVSGGAQNAGAKGHNNQQKLCSHMTGNVIAPAFSKER